MSEKGNNDIVLYEIGGRLCVGIAEDWIKYDGLYVQYVGKVSIILNVSGLVRRVEDLERRHIGE